MALQMIVIYISSTSKLSFKIAVRANSLYTLAISWTYDVILVLTGKQVKRIIPTSACFKCSVVNQLKLRLSFQFNFMHYQSNLKQEIRENQQF